MAIEQLKLATPLDTVTGFVAQLKFAPAVPVPGVTAREMVSTLSEVTTAPEASSTDTPTAKDDPAVEVDGG